MLWPENEIIDGSDLLQGADEEQVRTIEEQLAIKFPQEFIDFLLWADGGFIAERRFIVYSAGEGIHPEETLLAANRDRPPDFPLILIGREAEEEFGFRKEDLSGQISPVYFFQHEERKLDFFANSFCEAIKRMQRKING